MFILPKFDILKIKANERNDRMTIKTNRILFESIYIPDFKHQF